jgi:hypothetical protein
MIIVQDPADTTPHHTGRLCVVHNAQNATDRTARNGLALWKAAVSLDENSAETGGYLGKNYWANSVMHGAWRRSTSRTKEKMDAARRCCSKVLAAQIRALRPKILIAKGEKAVDSLREIGVINKPWSVMRHKFGIGPYREENQNWLPEDAMTVFCTYHTSARVVNQTLSESYHAFNTEESIEGKLSKLHERKSTDKFLSDYGNPASNAEHRGMRFLLNHWLDIGEYIRKSYETWNSFDTCSTEISDFGARPKSVVQTSHAQEVKHEEKDENTDANRPTLAKTPNPFYRANKKSWNYRYDSFNGSVVLNRDNLFVSSSELQGIAESMFGKGEPHNLASYLKFKQVSAFELMELLGRIEKQLL